MNKILSICIPVYNKINFTISCLKDLSKLPDDHEVLVFDNGSADNTEDEIKKLSQEPGLINKIVYKKNKINLGFAKACNELYSIASAPNVLFLNNDIRVKSNYENWTQPLLDHCPQGLVGPTMGQLDDNLNFVQEANRLLPGKSYMSGWCLASTKEIWEQLKIPRMNDDERRDIPQIFSEEFGLAYFEDVDLSFRAKEYHIGFKIADLPVVHFGKTTSRTLGVSKLYNDARQIFVKKWAKRIPK